MRSFSDKAGEVGRETSVTSPEPGIPSGFLSLVPERQRHALLFSPAPMVRAHARSRRRVEGTPAFVFVGAGLEPLASR